LTRWGDAGQHRRNHPVLQLETRLPELPGNPPLHPGFPHGTLPPPAP